ncbi:TRAP transporter large permease [Calidifontibacillus erzurumensis]|uniref:TRAP transporter large permease n=1 Tax=Calidifontibacillus erzurumensis TaxID=2741433 RepID=A0A8J8GEZ3_9BACI|nr:TRAP transporter large permease [Calidifontibacillus erzurumensis]NSL50593.1 TRAP transporter large permease [Calidifontibacillus erzurumensis]
MSPEMIGVLGIAALIVLFMLRIPVGISLLMVGLVGTALIRGLDIAIIQSGRTAFDTASSYTLSVIPLFILMGMILSYSGLGGDLYKAVDSWMGHLKGGLAMATIGTSAIFSSISGSLNATTMTVGKITLPEMEKYNYKPKLSTACVAAGGTLGVLIPPSVVLVLYGILTREPIGKLLIAGIIPGIVQIILFFLTIYILVRRDPSLAPVREEKASFGVKVRSLLKIWPFFCIFGISIGGIYLGVFTPTEAAAIGASSALLFALITRKVDFNKLKISFNETVRLTAYIFLILIGATLFSQFLTVSRIPVTITSYVGTLDLNPYLILIFILFSLFLLGCFIDGLSILVLTLPIIYPIVTDLGFNGIWFGVIMVIITNIGALTPPLGVSVYDVKGVAPHVPIETIFKGIIPMLLAMIACIVVLVIFPDLVTVLPNLMK